MANSKPIVVFGGTGHYGRHIVAQLLETGLPVRVLSRDRERAVNVLGSGVDVIEGDITSPLDVETALHGARALVVSVSAFSPKLIRRLWEIEHDAVVQCFHLAQKVGVPRVVYVSGYDIDKELVEKLGLEIGRLKAAVEEALAATNLNWTVLGAPPPLDLFFAFLRGAKLWVPGGGPPALPTIASCDLGAIVAQAAVRDDLGGRRFRLAGPDVLSFPQAARILSDVTGKPVAVRTIPLIFPRIAGALVGPFYPYVRHIVAALRLLNSFPKALADQAAADHRMLLETFDYTPTTLRVEAQRRIGGL